MVLDHRVLGKQLTGLHLLAALKLNEPLIAITEDQGNELAKITCDIIKEYGLTVSTKMALFTQLLLTCTAIYAPKIVAIKNKRNTHSAEIYQFQNAPEGKQ